MLKNIFPTFTALYVRDSLRRWLPQISGDVLNIGAGERHYEDLRDETCTIFSVDLMPFPDIDLQANVYMLPFQDGTFSTVIATEVFEHLQDPRAAVKELHRVLKPQGKLLLTVPFLYRVHSDPDDYFRYTVSGLNAVLEGYFSGDTLVRGNRFTVIMDLLSTSSAKWYPGKILRVMNRFIFPIVASAQSRCMPSAVHAKLHKVEN
jgi:SAM-dependent methyltransferase